MKISHLILYGLVILKGEMGGEHYKTIALSVLLYIKKFQQHHSNYYTAHFVKQHTHITQITVNHITVHIRSIN